MSSTSVPPGADHTVFLTTEPGGTDQAYVSWRCEGDTETCRGAFDYTGGTGKYQGISSSNTFTDVIHANWPASPAATRPGNR